MPPTTDLTAVVVTWNRPQLLRRCLRSLVRAAYEAGLSLQMIVVDNGSTAGDADLVATEFSDAVLIRNESNMGFARANNVALQRAAGRHALLVNNDVEVSAAALGAAVKLLDSTPGVAVVGARMVDRHGKEQLSRKSFTTPVSALVDVLGMGRVRGLVSRNDPAPTDVSDWVPVDYVVGAFLMIRRDVIGRIGVLDERFYFYAEEADWCWRCREAGYRVAWLGGATVMHDHGASTNGSSGRYRAWLLESNGRFLSKHYGRIWYPALRLAAIVGAVFAAVKGLALFAAGVLTRSDSRLRGGRLRLGRAAATLMWGVHPQWVCPEFFT